MNGTVRNAQRIMADIRVSWSAPLSGVPSSLALQCRVVDEQMVRKYIEKINVDCFLKTVEPNFTSEYERIKKYVF